MTFNNVEIKIVDQGSIVVSHAYATLVTKDVALINVELVSKYADVIGGFNDNYPGILLDAKEVTLYTHTDEEGITAIIFPQFKGWDVFCAEKPYRSTAKVVLVRG